MSHVYRRIDSKNEENGKQLNTFDWLLYKKRYFNTCTADLAEAQQSARAIQVASLKNIKAKRLRKNDCDQNFSV